MKPSKKQTSRILVVDDSESTRVLIKTYLRRGGYEVVEAGNGQMGLEICSQQPIDLVILDIHMPVMDGFSLCRQLQNDIKLQSIPVIILSVCDDAESKVRAFEVGAVDYLSKPVGEGELLARINTHLTINRLTISLQKANRELSLYQDEMQRELLAAADLQKSLLPKSVPDCKELRFASYFKPCQEVGGDIFNIQRLNNEYLAMYILDVAGHGFSAAMMTALATQALSGCAAITWKHGAEGKVEQVVSPKNVIRKLNKEFPIERYDCYITMVYLLFNTQDHSFRYCCAGHPPIVHVKREGDVVFLDKGGPPAGVDGSWDEGEGHLNSGDRLFFYTDGLIDYRNEAGECYSRKRLVDSMVDNWGYPLTGATCNIIDALEDFGNQRNGEDDMTLLAVEKR